MLVVVFMKKNEQIITDNTIIPNINKQMKNNEKNKEYYDKRQKKIPRHMEDIAKLFQYNQDHNIN